jgi:hypothetical protein
MQKKPARIRQVFFMIFRQTDLLLILVLKIHHEIFFATVFTFVFFLLQKAP